MARHLLTTIEGTGTAAGLRFGIIRSRFNESVSKGLMDGALRALREGGTQEEAIDVVLVPGAFEIPLVAATMARSGRYHALICLGAVIRGETPHFEYISTEVSRGIARVSYDSGLPVIFGVLTTDTEEQAEARSGLRREGARLGAPGAGGCDGNSNKGYEAGQAAIEMATLMKKLDQTTASAPTKRTSRKVLPRKRTR